MQSAQVSLDADDDTDCVLQTAWCDNYDCISHLQVDPQVWFTFDFFLVLVLGLCRYSDVLYKI